MLPTAAPGLPAPPGCPAGDAVKAPRRLPAGGSGGAPTDGCRFRAIRRPGEPDALPPAADPLSVGGGATTCGAPRVACRPPATARWSATASCGAGAMTGAGAMFKLPVRREGELDTSTGGASGAACSAWVIEALAVRSVGGAATGSCRLGKLRLRAGVASWGGAVTELGNAGARRAISAAGESGASGIASRGFTPVSDQATTFGIGTSRLSFTLGGVTIVCVRLSDSRGTEMIAGDRHFDAVNGQDSRGTEMIAWRVGAGSAWRGGSAEALRVSSGGTYSDGL